MSVNDITIFQENASSDYVARLLTSIASGKVLTINVSNLPEFRALTESDITNLTTDLAAKIASTEKGAANGIAPLGSDSKISTTYLPSSVLGAANYQGTWNATTNTPTIPAASSSNKGYYYTVATAGSTNVDGITDWKIGDWIISNGSAWEKLDNTDGVTSVNGYTGIIVLTKSDLSLGSVDNIQQMPLSYLDTDNTLAANSDAKVSSQKAVKAFIATQVASAGLNWVTAPASSGASGTAGQIAYDNDYLYICVATNTWKKLIGVTW